MLALCVSCFLLVRAQGPTANVTVRSESDRDPVQVTRLFLGDQQLTSGVDFPIDPDWIKNLRFEVKNVSNQNIKVVWLVLYLKDKDHSYKLDFTLRTNHWDGKNRYFTDDFTLHPGETAMVGYNPDLYEGFKKALANQNLVLPTRGFILLHKAVFGDRTDGWFYDYDKPYHREGDSWVEDSTKAPGWKDLL